MKKPGGTARATDAILGISGLTGFSRDGMVGSLIEDFRLEILGFAESYAVEMAGTFLEEKMTRVWPSAEI
jgi:hypothetical protein